MARRDVKYEGFADTSQGKVVAMSDHVFVIMFFIEMTLKVR